jgi:FkbM family methyltransferase
MTVKNFAKKVLNRLGYDLRKAGRSVIINHYSPLYLSRLCQPQTVFDIGVGYGTFALYESFPKSYFVLVEPLAEYQKSIQAILARYKGEIHYKAAGSHEGWREINVDKSHLQMSSFANRAALTKTGNTLQKRKVEVTTLDTIFQNGGPRKGPIVLKIDTEGNELSVLEGSNLLLQSTDFVIAEVSIARRFENGYEFEELISFMRKKGFSVFSFLHIEHEENELRPRFADIIFCRN